MQINRRLISDSLWNFVGIGLPLLVGVAVVPALIGALGTERFGLLSMIWMVVGYFSLFDFGIGRALTKLAADHVGLGQQEKIPSLAWTALTLITSAGALVGAAFIMLAPLMAQTLNIAPSLLLETTSALRWIGLAIPLVLIATALTGLLDAFQRFAWINLVRIPLGIFTFIGPLAATHFSQSLEVVTGVLVAGRILALLALGVMCGRVMPGLYAGRTFRGSLLRPLVRFGSWLTISNVVGPVMVYFDRFFIAAILGGTAVAYYTVPYDVLTRLFFVATAVMQVLFPAFTVALKQNRARARELFVQGAEMILVAMIPISAAVLLIAPELLEAWVGQEFSAASTTTARLLAVGVLINSVTWVPFTFVQSSGRVDLTAKIHLAELPFYLTALWMATSAFGIEGAAAVWLGRIVVDTAIFYSVIAAMEKELRAPIMVHLAIMVIALTGMSLGVLWLESFFARLVLLSFVLIVCACLAWLRLKDVTASVSLMGANDKA